MTTLYTHEVKSNDYGQHGNKVNKEQDKDEETAHKNKEAEDTEGECKSDEENEEKKMKNQ